MKLTAFLGSPRPKGNTDILAARVLDGAAEAGVETETITLRRLSIRPCTGCEKCWRDGRPCVFRDDMAGLYDTIARSDALLFATPVYWYAPTAIIKAFIDRLVPFNRPQGQPLIRGRGVLLVTAYEEEGDEAVQPLLRMFDLSFDYLGLKLLGRVVVSGVGPKGAVLEKPEALEQAYQAGLSVAVEGLVSP
jgi:multimeric flavodoxin WrbA